MKRQRLVLVADDYEDAAELLAELLSLEFGCPTVWVKDGAEALAVGLARKPLAALLDIDMPRMKGTEVARKLREQRGKTILLVAITGRTEVESLRPLHLFDLVFQKPLTDEDRAEIERHIDALLDG
jgi:CheY-like chemotaxis protein